MPVFTEEPKCGESFPEQTPQQGSAELEFCQGEIPHTTLVREIFALPKFSSLAASGSATDFAANIRDVLALPGWSEEKRHDLLNVIRQLATFTPRKSKSFEKTPYTGADPLWRLIVGNRPVVTPEELESWAKQKLTYRDAGSMRLALIQDQPGPCGVLASLQCWLIAAALFLRPSMFLTEETGEQDGTSVVSTEDTASFEKAILLTLENTVMDDNNETGTASHTPWCPLPPTYTFDPFSPCHCIRVSALLWSLCITIVRATPTTIYRWATVQHATNKLLRPDMSNISEIFTVDVVVCQGAEELIAYLSQHASEVLTSPTSVLSFLVSLLLTSTIGKIKEETDDPSAGLIGRFGHSTQELVNLVLTGQAVSNVFDWSKSLGTGEAAYQVRGIDNPQMLGYLTELEVARLCEVGNNLKKPLLPVWVVGSATHFTVLFSLDPRVSRAPAKEQLENAIGHIYDQEDTDGVGFLGIDRLPNLLNKCSVSASSLVEARNVLDPGSETGVFVRGDFIDWVQRKLEQSTKEPPHIKPKRYFSLYHIDGRGVGVKRYMVDTWCDGNSSITTESALHKVIQTRWPEASLLETET